MNSVVIDELQRENIRLKSELATQSQLRAQIEQRVIELTLEVARLKRQIFGPKAERLKNADSQLSLLAILEELGRLNAGELDAGDRAESMLEKLRGETDAASTQKQEKPPKKSHGRRDFTQEDLPLERIVLEPVADTSGLVKIGEEVSSHIDHRPGSLVRVEVVRPKYIREGETSTAASSSKSANALIGVLIADAPDLPITKGIAGPGLLAHVLVSKYADHLPLHRQERIFRREGLALARSTLCGFVQGCTALLRHVVDAMWQDAKENSPLLLTDAAGVLILQKERCRRGHFQVFIAPKQHVLFKFLRHNNGDAVADLLDGFRGKLHSDASAVYHETHRREPSIIEVGCWAHARRGFFESLAIDRERALAGIGFIGALYDANDAATDPVTGRIDGEKRKALALPVLENLQKWIWQERPLATASRIDVAMGYIERQWQPLTRFLEDKSLRLDNNPSELELRHQVVGRKNWLFCASDAGAEDNATVVSLIASCKMHDIEPWAYLKDLLSILPAWPASRVLELAPVNWMQSRQKPDVIEMIQSRKLLGRGHADRTVAQQKNPA